MDQEVLKLVKNIHSIAALPAVYFRLTKVINHPHSSIYDIGKVVSQEPGLTARILRLVNSAFYGFPGTIETVSHAISLIGTRQLQDIALATSVVQLFKEIPVEQVSMESFWKHSLYTGITARGIATQKREPNAERYFVAGLLHDVGRLVIYMKKSQEANLMLNERVESGQLLIDLEKKYLGYDHTHVGHALLKNWNLPASLQEAVLYHHQPSRSKKNPTLAAVVHLADLITNAREIGSSGERAVPPLDAEAWQDLSLPSTMLNDLLDDCDRQFKVTLEIILR